MSPGSQTNETLKLIAYQVFFPTQSSILIKSINLQVLMMNKDSEAKNFSQLGFHDLIMFTITNIRIENTAEQVHMVISLKRKILTELLTTYLPTLLLLIVSYATTFFKPIYFEASLTVNLTIMLVMTTIFTSKIEELPPTSDTKMIDIWLIFCLLVPFSFTLVQTGIECYREDEKERVLSLDEVEFKAQRSSSAVLQTLQWAGGI